MRYWLLSLGLFCGGVAAQSGEPSSAIVEPLSSPYLLKLTGGLILVVMLILALAWLVKKFNLNQQTNNGLMRIVTGMPLGTRDRIVLLQIGEEQILLGLTPGRIEKLHTMSQLLKVDETHPVGESFARKLNRIMGERKT